MGCDIHICIQTQDAYGVWAELSWQQAPYDFGNEPEPTVPGIPVAPKVFRNRNYDLFGILANVRNGVGFAGCVTGTGWPTIADGRGVPEGFDVEAVEPDPQYPDEGPRSLGDHSFTWVSLEELRTFPWDTTEQWAYGVVPADDYERLSASGDKPSSWSGGIFGPGIHTYEPDAYKAAKASGTLAPRPYVRMGWAETAREATNDWPGHVIPWLDTLAEGRPLRLILGFDS